MLSTNYTCDEVRYNHIVWYGGVWCVAWCMVWWGVCVAWCMVWGGVVWYGVAWHGMVVCYGTEYENMGAREPKPA